METRTKWIVGIVVVALVALLAIGCACGLIGFLGIIVSEAPKIDAYSEAATRRGERDGASGTTDECVREGYARSARCGTIEAACLTAADDYLRACLRSVPEPREALCDGAPERSGLLADSAFGDRMRAYYGWSPNDIPSDGVIIAIETHCQANRRLGR